jgi:hypothetical protein
VIRLFLLFLLTLQGIPVQVQQAGTVSGVLKDSAGKPLPGIRMAAIARPQSQEEAITGAAMSSLAETDGEGRYKLEGIPAGRYYIAAGRLDAQTYYPGTTNLATAKEVTITPGSTLSQIDFVLGETSFGRANTSGTIISPNAPASIPLTVTVEGGGKIPISAGGKFVSVKLEMGTIINTPISSRVVSVSGPPQTAAYIVTVENLPDTYDVKSITYGTANLRTTPLRLLPENFPGGTAQVLQFLPPRATPGGPAGAILVVTGQTVVSMLASQPPVTPPSALNITLAVVPPKSQGGARVSGRMSTTGNRIVYGSGVPGIGYSDGTFDVYGLQPGYHSIVTRDNRVPSRPLAAAVIVGDRNIDGVVLVETALLPNDAWEPRPPRPAGNRAAGPVPLARITGTLVEESSRQPIAEGTVVIKSNSSAPAFVSVDAEGRFELPSLLPGTYDVEFQVFGHSSAKQSIEIDDKDVKLELATRKLY